MDINFNRINLGYTTSNANSNQSSDVAKSVSKEQTEVSNTADAKEQRVNEKDLKTAVDTANNVLFKNNSHLKFEIHEKTKDVLVSIVDNETGETLKEIPPKKIIDMINKLCEIAGVLVDEKR